MIGAAKVRAKVKGLVDGNAPYLHELTRTGQSFRTNVNFREGESFLNMGMSAFFDVFAEVPTYATVRIKHGSEYSEKYSRIITGEFDRLQKKDGSFDFMMQLSQHEMVLYGTGPMVFEDGTDWRCQPLKSADLLVPEGTDRILRIGRCAWCVASTALTSCTSLSATRKLLLKLAGLWTPLRRLSCLPTQTLWQQPPVQPERNNDSYCQQVRLGTGSCVFYREFPTDENPEGALTPLLMSVVRTRNSCSARSPLHPLGRGSPPDVLRQG